jgi:hypothetical protein
MHIKLWLENLERRNHMEDLGSNWRIIIKETLRENRF